MESYDAIKQIEIAPTYPGMLYTIDKDPDLSGKFVLPDDSDRRLLEINISAIVGQNGSGKNS